jgi:hypothetical protein
LRGVNFGGGAEVYCARRICPDDLTRNFTGNLLHLAGRFDDAQARAEKVLKTRGDLKREFSSPTRAGLNISTPGEPNRGSDQDRDRSGTYSNLWALELSRGRRDLRNGHSKSGQCNRPVQARVALGIFYWLTVAAAAGSSR